MSPADGSAAFAVEETRLRPLDLRHVVIQPAIAHPSSANGLHNVVRSLIAEQRAMGDDARLCLFSDDPDALTGIPADCPGATLPPRRTAAVRAVADHHGRDSRPPARRRGTGHGGAHPWRGEAAVRGARPPGCTGAASPMA
ncbi:hypothetical protein [Azospirillum baldaniorum]|uniref:Uncharacterized protein n=1 Tax=Azospirillum baldaniorum TaxID=1064539 RepID=A0A9P1JX95_9PROT|nr:hypothetical protein [Azospirillum baldaniorum]CCD01509.1 protein of unknown function [Azospirillum baldaniorum]